MENYRYPIMDNTPTRKRNSVGTWCAIVLFVGFVLAAFIAISAFDNNSDSMPVHTPTTVTVTNDGFVIDTATVPNNSTSNAIPVREIGPCVTEDSDNCFRLFGGKDGVGRSYVVINGVTYYLHN